MRRRVYEDSLIQIFGYQVAVCTGPGRKPRGWPAPTQNEPELGQDFTLSSSRPSQSIPGMILRLVRSGLQIT